MNHKKTLTLLVVLVLGLAQFGFSQIAHPHAKRTLGYMNPITGQFEPLKQTVSPEALPAVTPTTGTLTFHFKITLKAAPPTNTVVSCNGDVQVFDTATGQFFDENATGIATGSGSSYSCNAVIHYSWLLSNPGTAQMQFTTSAGAEYGFQATASNGSQTVVQLVPWRISTQPNQPIAIPANGATTTQNVSVTL